jgi:hypothetical protein
MFGNCLDEIGKGHKVFDLCLLDEIGKGHKVFVCFFFFMFSFLT